MRYFYQLIRIYRIMDRDNLSKLKEKLTQIHV